MIEEQNGVLTISLDDNRTTEEVLVAPDILSSEPSDTKQIVDPTDEEILNTLCELFGQVREKPPGRPEA